MIGIDSNVLVRYFVQDDPKQSAAAGRVLEKQCTRHRPGQVCHVVLCEVVWVLMRAYGYDKKQVIDVIRLLLQTVELEVDRSDLVERALNDYERGSADFSDYLIAHLNVDAGATETLTFDEHAAEHAMFRLIK